MGVGVQGRGRGVGRRYKGGVRERDKEEVSLRAPLFGTLAPAPAVTGYDLN